MNRHFCVRLLGCWEIFSEVVFTSVQHIENEMVLFSLLSQLKLLFGALVILFVWYILKQLFCLLYESGGYLPPLRLMIVNYDFFCQGFWGMKSFRYFLEVSSSSCVNLLFEESGCETRFVSMYSQSLLCLEKFAKWYKLCFHLVMEIIVVL